MEKIGPIINEFIHGNSFKKFQRMPQETKKDTIIKTMIVAAIVGLIAGVTAPLVFGLVGALVAAPIGIAGGTFRFAQITYRYTPPSELSTFTQTGNWILSFFRRKEQKA